MGGVGLQGGYLMTPVLRERRKVINWFEDNQADVDVKQFAGERRVKRILDSVESN